MAIKLGARPFLQPDTCQEKQGEKCPHTYSLKLGWWPASRVTWSLNEQIYDNNQVNGFS